MSRQTSTVGARAAPPLIETKLAPARARPGLVIRPRLIGQLDRFASVPLTLVAAPVGFGKTLLVESWLGRAGGAVAWVSLEPGDNDPARLWTYLAASVDRVRSGLGRRALAGLRSPGAPPENVVDELVNGLHAYGEPVAIILDDAHAISDEVCWRSLEHLVEHLPRHVRVIVTTRSDPPLPLGRLRARGALGEIRARELAFTVDEARELLIDREGIPLGDDDVELLVDRTEGWPAGLYLAALWLRDVEDTRAGVQAFHGDHRHVADYLTSEVLDRLDEDTRGFLLETSILGVFSAPLCDMALGRADSAERLRALERQNGFLTGLDPRGDWYRYHHLFGELLQLELATVEPAAPARLHTRASEWCWENGRLEDALEHAAAAGDTELVARIFTSEHRTLLLSGRLATVLRWCTWLPDQVLLDRAELPIAGALAAGLTGLTSHTRRRFIATAERSRTERPHVWSPYHEAALGLTLATWIETDVGAAITQARETLEIARRVPEVEVPMLASLAFLLFLAGEHSEAGAFAREALDRPEAPARPHGYVLALAARSLVDSATGRPEAAQEHADQAVTVAAEAGVDQSASGGAARVARAVALAARGRLRAAEREALEGERLRRCPDPEATHLHALLVRAGIRARRGLLDLAAADLDRARTGLETFTDAGRLPDLAAAVEKTLEKSRAAAAVVFEAPSEAELNVLRLLATDLSQREIGARLYVSVNTVKTHTRTLYRKLGVTSRDAAVERANALGLLDST